MDRRAFLGMRAAAGAVSPLIEKLLMSTLYSSRK